MKYFVKIIRIMLAIILSLNVVTVQISAVEVSSSESAELLSMIGMFKGSDRGFELERQPSRIEGLVMMLRLFGKEENALSYVTEVKTFDDVPEWGERYVQYAYDNGLTKGLNDSEFGSYSTIDSKSYLTFILRALGYEDNADFEWTAAEEKSIELGLIEGKIVDFTRGDMATITLQALHTKVNGYEKTLIQSHVENQVISQEGASKLIAIEQAYALNGINIMYPPAPLIPCVSDGVTDVTTELQAIVDYCGANNKALIIPSGETFRISQIKMDKMNGFTLYGYGTLKRIDGFTSSVAMLQFNNCDNLTIPILHTNGNIDNNLNSWGGRFRVDAHSVGFRNIDGLHLGKLYDVDPCGDSFYFNGTDNVDSELLSATSAIDCGRNGVSIIAGDNMAFKEIISTNIGVARMPGGFDIEPNNGDHISNVTVHKLRVHSIATGFQVSNAYGAGASITDVDIRNAHITRTHSSKNISDFANIIQGVTNSVFDVTTVQNVASDGVVLIKCDGIDYNMNIDNSTRGLIIYDTHNFNITGSINDTDQGSVHFDAYNAGDTSSNGVIDMTLKNSDRNNEGEYGAVFNIWKSTLNNITFKGDYAKDVTGANVIRNEGIMTNCRLEDLDVIGFSNDLVITGFGSTDLGD